MQTMSQPKEKPRRVPKGKITSRCGCPRCREGVTAVTMTSTQDDGVTLRRRWCTSCGHRWYTAQEPEYLVRRVVYTKQPGGKVLLSLPPEDGQ